jgi:hypothetical protein
METKETKYYAIHGNGNHVEKTELSSMSSLSRFILISVK